MPGLGDGRVRGRWCGGLPTFGTTSARVDESDRQSEQAPSGLVGVRAVPGVDDGTEQAGDCPNISAVTGSVVLLSAEDDLADTIRPRCAPTHAVDCLSEGHPCAPVRWTLECPRRSAPRPGGAGVGVGAWAGI